MNGSFGKTVEVKWLIVKVKANRLHTYRKSPAWKKCLVFCKLSTKNNHKWSQIRFPCLFSLTEKGWDIISRDLTPSEKFQWISSILFDINRVFFLLGFPCVCFVRNRLKKNVRAQAGPPLKIEKKSKCSVILILRRFRGGPVEGFLGGASLKTFSGEAQLKKSPCS